MIADQANLISSIPLERPASVRRLLPTAADSGWLLPDYFVGAENEGLRYLFDPETILKLSELSPIVLYGEPGVGKTSLVVTLAVTWARLTGRRPLAFTTGAAFSEDFSAALEIDDVDSFRGRHRECQLLVLDGLEQLAKSTAAQTELIGTFDSLLENASPLIVSACRLPASVRGLSSALTSRLSQGLSLPIRRPEADTAQQIVRALIPIVDPGLPADELAHFCARFAAKPFKVDDLARLVRIAGHNKNAAGAVDFHVVSQLANQLFAGESLTPSAIAKVVARKSQVKLADMRGSTRKANIVRARGLAILLMRRLTSVSLQQIGEFFGGRDHSTVIHACRKTELLLDSDAELANLLQEAMAELLSSP